MKQYFFSWIIGVMITFPVESAQATPTSIYNYPHYLNGKPVPPEQKTPHSSCCHCEETAKIYGEQLLHYYMKNIPHEPFMHISVQQMSWNTLNKRFNNHLVFREIYLINFIKEDRREYKVIAMLDSTEEECGLFNRFYSIDKFLDEDFSHAPQH